MADEIQVVHLVGRRVLAKLSLEGPRFSPIIEEYRVLEASPSTYWVRLRNQHGKRFWIYADNFKLVEILHDGRAERKAEVAELERGIGSIDEQRGWE